MEGEMVKVEFLMQGEISLCITLLMLASNKVSCIYFLSVHG